jgi:hypothetical membrane protein
MSNYNTPQLHKEHSMQMASNDRVEAGNGPGLAGIILVVAALAWFVLEAIAASRFPAYSYVSNYISDLGVPDPGSFQGRALNSPWAALANFMFVTQGLAFLAAAVLIVRSVSAGLGRTLFLLFAVGYAVGYVLIGAFHGSAQATADGTFALHVAGGSLAALCGNAAIIAAALSAHRLGASAAYRNVSIGISAVSIASLVILVLTSDTATGNQVASGPWDGLWERGGCYAIILWELFTGVVLLAARRKRGTSSI